MEDELGFGDEWKSEESVQREIVDETDEKCVVLALAVFVRSVVLDQVCDED